MLSLLMAPPFRLIGCNLCRFGSKVGVSWGLDDDIGAVDIDVPTILPVGAFVVPMGLCTSSLSKPLPCGVEFLMD